MSQYVETASRSFEAGGAIGRHLRVTLTAGQLALAGIGVRELGTVEEAAFAAGDRRAVRLRTAQGTTKMVAAGAITAGADVYTAANGLVNVSAAGAYLVGTALEAAGAAGDVIEVLRTNHGDTVVP